MALRVDERWPGTGASWQARATVTITGAARAGQQAWTGASGAGDMGRQAPPATVTIGGATRTRREAWTGASGRSGAGRQARSMAPVTGAAGAGRQAWTGASGAGGMGRQARTTVTITGAVGTGRQAGTGAGLAGRQAWAAAGRVGVISGTAPRRLRRRRAGQPVPIYSYMPPKVVADDEWALPKRWPSRFAPAGLLFALGMGVAGMVVAQPGASGPPPGAGENTLAMRLPYVPSQLPAMVPEDWAKGLPPAALPWVVPIQQVATAESLDPRLLASLVWVESNFDPTAVSPKGAVGLAQVMPETAKELGIRLRDPLENLAGGAHYLRINMERFGQVDLALAAYNGGPTRMTAARTLSRLPDPDIRTYVTRVLQTFRGLGGGT
jgi:soluble lytic murein transglycosylase-like protein